MKTRSNPLNLERPYQFAQATGAALLALFCFACAHPPRPTGYLETYDTLVAQPPPCVSVYADGAVGNKGYRVDHVLLVMPSRWDAPRLKYPSHETELLEFLDHRFRIYMRRYAPDSTIVTTNRDVDDFIEAGARVTQVRLSITDYRRGIGLIRMLIGFQLAAAHLQVEGRLSDLKSGEVLAAFARRGVNDGVVWGLPTPQSLSAKYCWKLSSDVTADLLARCVALRLVPPPPRWWEALDSGPPPGAIQQIIP